MGDDGRHTSHHRQHERSGRDRHGHSGSQYVQQGGRADAHRYRDSRGYDNRRRHHGRDVDLRQQLQRGSGGGPLLSTPPTPQPPLPPPHHHQGHHHHHQAPLISQPNPHHPIPSMGSRGGHHRNYQRRHHDRGDRYGRRGGRYDRDPERERKEEDEARRRALVGYDVLFDKFKEVEFGHFQVPDPSQLFSAKEGDMLQEMHGLKERTSEVRSKLDNFNIGIWKKLTRFTNPTGNVVRELWKQCNPELCTNAWAKMFELLVHFDLIPIHNDDKVASVHACEAPGGFITATNHFLHTHRNLRSGQWSWLGNSLNPYHEENDPVAMVESDDFIASTFPHWYFGANNTGDIRNRDNIEGMWERAKQLEGKVLLFTADGSIDCQFAPNEQEMIVAQLHYCEAVAGLGCLHTGGAMVLKMFTLFERPTMALLYLLGSLFDHLYVTKPACSRASNAETYVVAKGFRGISPELLQHLLDFTGPDLPTNEQNERLALLDVDKLGEDFVKEITKLADSFSGWFTACIERNIDLHLKGKGRREDNAIREGKWRVLRTFMDKYRPGRLKGEEKIVRERTVSTQSTSRVVSREHGNTQSLIHGTTQEERQQRHREHMQHRKRGYRDAHAGGGGTQVQAKEAATQGSLTTTATTAITRTESPGGGDGDSEGPPRRRAKVMTGEGGTKAATTATAAVAEVAGSTFSASASSQHTPATASGSQAQKAPAAIQGSSIGKNLLAKAGYKGEGGLGREGQGRQEPIAVEMRSDRVGLGFQHHRLVGVEEGMDDSPWFERHDDEGLAASWMRYNLSSFDLTSDGTADAETRERIRNKQQPLTAGDVAAWEITKAPALRFLLCSKFCRQQHIVNLQKQRRDASAAIARYARTTASPRLALQCGVAANAAAALLQQQQPRLTHPVAYLEMAHLQAVTAFLPETEQGGVAACVLHESLQCYAQNLDEHCSHVLLPAFAGQTRSDLPPNVVQQHEAESDVSAQAGDGGSGSGSGDGSGKEDKYGFVRGKPEGGWRKEAWEGDRSKEKAEEPGGMKERGGAVAASSSHNGLNNHPRAGVSVTRPLHECSALAERLSATTLGVAVCGMHLDLASQVYGDHRDVNDRYYKEDLLDQLIVALQHLKDGGSLVVVLADTFTRFIASTLYILFRCFSQMRLLKPFSLSPLSCSRFAVCRGYHGSAACSAAISHLTRTLRTLRQLAAEGKGMDVLCFVDPPVMLERTFLVHVTTATERFAQREAACIRAFQSRLPSQEGKQAQGGGEAKGAAQEQGMAAGQQQERDLPTEEETTGMAKEALTRAGIAA